MVRMQREALAEQAAGIAAARAVLDTVAARLDQGEAIDVATFCTLIRQGDVLMEQDRWQAVIDRHFTPAEQAHWQARQADLPAGFDQAEYAAQWRELGARIKAALPLDPGSAAAQALLAEWQALLAPFQAVASPEMMRGAAALYDRMDTWQGDGPGQADPGFDAEVWAFIKAAGAAASATTG